MKAKDAKPKVLYGLAVIYQWIADNVDEILDISPAREDRAPLVGNDMRVSYLPDILSFKGCGGTADTAVQQIIGKFEAAHRGRKWVQRVPSDGYYDEKYGEFIYVARGYFADTRG